MASGMSNFNIKKSFVWKYGLSKLHKKKDSEEVDGGGEPRALEEDVSGPLEPDLELRPQWEPPLAGADPEVPQKRRGTPLVPAVHAPAASRTMDTAVSQYIRVVAQMQGYDVAGCRGMLRDGVVPFPKPEAEPPIYETLSEFPPGDDDDDGGGTIAEDQQTLYENDDTDEEMSAPLYENSTLEQPVYANGMLLGEPHEEDEAPIYENLGGVEALPSLVPNMLPTPAGVSEPTYGHLEVEVRSDHGYDSYQSPTSDSSDLSGDSPAKLSPNSESSGSECGAAQRALASATEETGAPSCAGIPPPPPLPPPPPVTSTMARAKKALGQTASLPPTGRQGGAERPKLDLPATKQDRPASEIENKLSTSFVAQLHDMLQKKTSVVKHEPGPSKAPPSPAQQEKSTEKSVEKRRSKTGDTMAFQMARKAVAQALQKGRPQEPQESTRPKLTQSLSVPSDKPDVTAPVERVAVVPGVIPPPPPMPAPAASGAGKLSASLMKMSAPKSLQHDLKKKIEAKKATIHAEKVEPKKKKLAPKPPDRSFSLPGFGNARLDIARAFEEFKRNEAIKKEEALMKKKKSKYVDKLDLKDYKKPSSNTGEVEEEMFALAAESADAMSSELDQRPPMKSFLSDDRPAPQAEKTTTIDGQSTASLVAQREESTVTNLPTERSDSIPEESSDSIPEESDIESHALPARSGLISEPPPSPPPQHPAVQRLAEHRGETSFECVAEQCAEPLPPRPRSLTKKPQLLQRPVQRAVVTPPDATVTPPPAAMDTPSAAMVTPPSAAIATPHSATMATPPPAAAIPPPAAVTTLPVTAAVPPATQKSTPPATRPGDVHSQVTVSGSQVIQICPDGSWGVTERNTAVSSDTAVPAEQCQVEVNINEHGTSVISTVELVSGDIPVSGTDSSLGESNMSHCSADEPNKIKLKLGEMEITDKNELTLEEPHVDEPIIDKMSDEGVISNDQSTDESGTIVFADEPEKLCQGRSNTDGTSELCVDEQITAAPIPDQLPVKTITVESEPVTVEPCLAKTSAAELSTVGPVAAESITAEPNTADLNTTESCTTDLSSVARCTYELNSSVPAGGSSDSTVGSHPRQMSDHAWAERDRGVAADCPTELHAPTQTETDRVGSGDGPARPREESAREESGDSEGEEGEERSEETREGEGQSEETREGKGPSGEEAREEDQEVRQVGEVAAAETSEVREGDRDPTAVPFGEDLIAQDSSASSVNDSPRVETELKHPELACQDATEIANSDSRCHWTEDHIVNATDKHVLAIEAEETEDSSVTPSGEQRSAEVETPAESEVVTAAIQSIKLHVLVPEAVCDSNATEQVQDACDEVLAEPAESTEDLVPEPLPETDTEATVTRPEEKKEASSAQEKTKMPLFRASVVEVESAPSSLEEPVNNRADPDEVACLAPAPAPAPVLVPVSAPITEIASVDDIEAQVAALRSKVLSVNSISSGEVTPAPAPAPAEVSRQAFSGQLLPPPPGQLSPQARPARVTEVERQFEDLERTGGEEEADVLDDTSAEMTDKPTEELPPPAADDTETTDDNPTPEEVGDDAEDAPKSVESLSIIANKAQTRHFLESRLQESLGESVTPVTPAIPGSPAPAGPPSAKMATHEPISPPPGFDDAADDSAAGVGQVEGVEFEEFDMDWAPRRPVAPPVRSYMFGEQLGHKPAPAPARSPASPSYRDLFVADEPASSTASVVSVTSAASVASLDEMRQDSACGTSEPDEAEETVGSGAETMIAQEIRELRRREEELRLLREKAAPEPLGEEPLSGYGSEERESFTEEPPCPSRLLPCERAASHQRSRSADSLSSGHSSSGLGSDAGDLLARRRLTVRPLEEADDDQRWSYPRSAETPIEREIRLAKEREDERRREQAMLTSRHTMAAVFEEKPTTRASGVRATPAPAPAALANDPRQAALRLATGRVQEEIQEATRREIELRDEGKEITTSEETVDEKVTRLVDMTKHSVELANDKKQRADQARDTGHPAKPNLVPKPAVKPVHIVPRAAPEPAPAPAPAPAQTVSPAAGSLRGADTASRPVFRPVVTGGAGRGLMHKFIASRGRLRPVSVFSPSPSGAGAREPSPPRSRRPSPQLVGVTPAHTEHTSERRGPVQVPSRRVLTAEAKIQLELQAMREREEELRRHRSRMMAKSQPDLLAALDDLPPSQEEADDDGAPGPLSRAMSNPNLLDDGPTETPVASANRRRRSTLIDQWESRIQGAEI